MFKSACALVFCAALPIAVSLLVSKGVREVKGGLASDLNFGRARALFKERCSSCHQLDKDGPALRGPRLHDIGKVAETRKQGMPALSYLVESLYEPSAFIAPASFGGMPQGVMHGVAAADARDLIGYLASLGGNASRKELDQLSIPVASRVAATKSARRIDLERVAEGQALFRGKGNCIVCHALRPDPGFALAGPSLLDAASLPESHLRSSLLTPSATIAPDYQHVSAALLDGRAVSGRRLSQNDETLVILERDQNSAWRKTRVALDAVERAENGEPEINISPVSAMPKADVVLSPHEIDSVIMFLQTLKSI